MLFSKRSQVFNEVVSISFCLTSTIMKTFLAPAIAVIAVSALLSACASPSYPGSYGTYPYPASSTAYPPTNSYPYQVSYGVVESIQMTPGAVNQGSGAGAILGGVVGGLLGNQVGKGSGRTVATVAGAVGGAIAGNEIEKRNGGGLRSQYQLGIRLDNGAYQTVIQDNISDLQVGNRVRIENNTAYRY